MKKIYLLVALLVVLANDSVAQTNKHIYKPKQGAQKLEHKVRQYFFVMLTKGPNRDHDSAKAAAIQEGHMANIKRLYVAGKLKVAGPFGDKGDWLGIFIFDCATKEEVETLLKTDPAIAAGRLSYEIHPWWTAEVGSFVRGKPRS